MDEIVQETQVVTTIVELAKHTRHWESINIVSPIFLAKTNPHQLCSLQHTSTYFGPYTGFVYEIADSSWISLNVPNFDPQLNTVYFPGNQNEMEEYFIESFQSIGPSAIAKKGGSLIKISRKHEKMSA